MSLKTAWLYERDTGKEYAIGIVQSITDNVSTSNLTKSIVTYTAENAFTMDMSSTQQFTIKFERTNDSNDGNIVEYTESGVTKQRPMNNAEWITLMRDLINRWQARHDGYVLKYNGDSEYPNHKAINQVGYIKSFSTTYKCGVAEYITGTLVFQAGSMKPQKNMLKEYQTDSNDDSGNDVVTDVDDATFYSNQYNIVDDTKIIMTGSNQQDIFTLYEPGADKVNCVTSYSLTYGPTEPFPLLTMKIMKKRMTGKLASLVDDIVAGMNRIEIVACGGGTFIVTKCKSSDQVFTITAYAREEVYKGMQTGVYYSAESTPLTIIQRILSKKIQVGGTSLYFYPSDIIMPNNTDYFNEWNSWGDIENDEIMFVPTDTCWRVMSICAQYMGMTIWFAENKVFLARQNSQIMNLKWSKHIDMTFKLNTVDDSLFTDDDRKFCMRVVDVPSIGDEGIDTLSNKIGVTYTLGISQSSTGTVSSADYCDPNIISSQKVYGTRQAGTISIPEFRKLDLARKVANNIALLGVDTQLSITFTVSETRIENIGGSNHNVWRSMFPMVCSVNGLIDYNTGTHISNMSSYFIDDGDRKSTLPQKTFMSCITRNFPEFTSTYTFGRIANADLSQTTSNILQAIGNK